MKRMSPKGRRLIAFALICFVLSMLAPATLSLFAADGDAAVEEAAEAAAAEGVEGLNLDPDTLTYEEALAVVDYAASLSDDADAFADDNADLLDRANYLINKHDVPVYATPWSLLPPVIAIALALITKEVYSSLFVGILVGGFLYAGPHPIAAFEHVFPDGMIAQLADSYNVGILIFLVILGAMVILMNRAGGSAAFGRWAKDHIHTRTGAQIATVILGLLIFIDDYFNCLTVGSVMLPVADSHKISRAKLAYIIDATAAPICIIAPISSWAAAVTGFVEGANGFELFLRAIPYNLYAILTIVMMFALAFMKFDFGPMAVHEKNAMEKGDLFTTGDIPYQSDAKDTNPKGIVLDLVLPVIVLIAFSVFGMVYTGGILDGANFIDAFSDADASIGLVFGSVVALIISIIYYLCRRVLSFKQCMDAIPEGFKAMVPAILILTFAWTLKGMTDSLGAKLFVANVVSSSAGSLISLLPALVFVIGCLLAFATGTSWGTFGILIPIVVSVFGGNLSNELMIVSISACMAGAVCGDHCSPISDTTIMASAGAQSNHINHVNTQIPYAVFVAAVSFVGYLLAGFVPMWYVVTPIMIVVLIAALFVIKKITAGKDADKPAAKPAK